MPSTVFKSKRHDTGTSPELTLTPPAGASWDLNEAGVAVSLIARLPTDPTPKINASCVVTGPWTVRYDPIPTDVDTIGSYDVEIQVRRISGKQVTFPTVGFLKWEIATDLDNA